MFPPRWQPPPPPLAPRPPVWHKAVGIISVCLGGLQILCGFVGMVTGSAMTSMMRSFPRYPFPRVRPMTQPATQPATHPATQPAVEFPFDFPDPSEMFNVPDSVHYAQVAAQIVSLLAAGLLLLAGILLIQKRRQGARLHLVYVAVEAMAVLASVVATVALMNSLRFGQGFPFFRTMMRMQTILMVVMQIVLGLAYPVFLLIWFGRKAVRLQVSRWTGRNAARVA